MLLRLQISQGKHGAEADDDDNRCDDGQGSISRLLFSWFAGWLRARFGWLRLVGWFIGLFIEASSRIVIGIDWRCLSWFDFLGSFSHRCLWRLRGIYDAIDGFGSW